MKNQIILFSILSSIIYTFSFAQETEIKSNGRLILGTYQERTASISSGDIDGDGDNDVLVANGRHWPGQNRIFINDGRGIFTVEKDLGTKRETTYATELADLDNDGILPTVVYKVDFGRCFCFFSLLIHVFSPSLYHGNNGVF